MANPTENTAAAAAPKQRKKKSKRAIAADGLVHVQSTFNNTIITITDKQGNTVCWGSSGARGFKGSKRATPFAAQMAAEEAGRKAYEAGVRNVEVFVQGPGSGRETALRSLGAAGLKISRIQDVTPLPHNGCRPPKKRRV